MLVFDASAPCDSNQRMLAFTSQKVVETAFCIKVQSMEHKKIEKLHQ